MQRELIMSIFKHVPEIGEEVEKDNLHFKIIDSDSRSVKMVKVTINKS